MILVGYCKLGVLNLDIILKILCFTEPVVGNSQYKSTIALLYCLVNFRCRKFQYHLVW